MYCKFGYDLDKFGIIASYGANPVAILGNASGKYELIVLDDVETTLSKVKSDLQARGFYFVGVIAVLSETVQFALDEPLDRKEMAILSASYCRLIDERIKDRFRQTAPGDSLQFLEELWKLHDPRSDA